MLRRIVTVQTFGTKKATKGHNYFLITGYLVEIPSFKNTRYFVQNTHNPGQNIWNKIEKFSQTGECKKIRISTFACFLTAIAKV